MYSKCKDCWNNADCDHHKYMSHMLYVGVFMEGLFNAVPVGKDNQVYRDSLRWLILDTNEYNKKDLKLSHIYDILVDEYTSKIYDNGSIGSGNQLVHHKCKIMCITDDPDIGIYPCDICSSHIVSFEEITSPYFDYKSTKRMIKDR